VSPATAVTPFSCHTGTRRSYNGTPISPWNLITDAQSERQDWTLDDARYLAPAKAALQSFHSVLLQSLRHAVVRNRRVGILLVSARSVRPSIATRDRPALRFGKDPQWPADYDAIVGSAKAHTLSREPSEKQVVRGEMGR
jgi:hypothetical protein